MGVGFRTQDIQNEGNSKDVVFSAEIKNTFSWEAIKSDGTFLLSFALAACAHCAVALWDLRL